MKRNTRTTLGELRIGDRFHFLANPRDIWQVTGRAGNNTYWNQKEAGIEPLKYDEMSRNASNVVFLRHTVFIEGDLCKVGDLNVGDEFYDYEDLFTTYRIDQKENEYVWAIAPDGQPLQFVNGSYVIVLRIYEKEAEDEK